MQLSNLLLALATVTAAAAPSHPPVQKGAVQTIYQAPNGTWLENLIETCSSKLLATVFTPYAGVLSIDPRNPSHEASIIANLTAQPHSAATGATGITSLDPNEEIYYVATNNLDTTTFTSSNSQLWKLDLRRLKDEPNPQITLVTNITAGMVLNGMTALPHTNKILVADSFVGVVWRVDAHTHAVDVAINDTALAQPSAIALGVNGIHVRDSYLYFTNSGTNVYGKIPISDTGSATGAAEVLYKGTGDKLDDFTLFASGGANAAILAENGKSQIGLVKGDGSATAQSVASILGPTALIVGEDGRELFVSSAGNETAYNVPGQSRTTAGRISRVVL